MKTRRPTRKIKRKVPRQRRAARQSAPAKIRSEKTLKLVETIEAYYRDRRRKFEEFIQTVRELPPVERAVKWLESVAADPEGYDDLEALVYLSSKGFDLSAFIDAAREWWRRDENDAIASCMRGTPVYGPGRKKPTYKNKVAITASSEIENISEFLLRDFWRRGQVSMFSIDATMFRAMEWCRIGGFDRWFRRIAKNLENNVIRGEVDADWAIAYLFNMTRSTAALSMVEKALNRMLEMVELDRDGDFPWVLPPSRPFSDAHPIEDLSYAGALIFAAVRLRGLQFKSPLIDKAVELLLSRQTGDGFWPASFKKDQGSVETTAIAIHALAIVRPLGWDRQVKKAASWLLTKQNEGGYWREDTSPDPTYLTVLVLDALELAEGRNEVTFNSPDSTPKHTEKSKDVPRRFRVAVSFPGEVRELVESVVRLLETRLGKKSIFYDKDFEAELAVVDLDLRLQRIYRDESDLIVVFVAKEYNKKEWCGLEWRGIRDLIRSVRSRDIMLLKMKGAQMPSGTFFGDGYVDISDRSAKEIAGLIYERLSINKQALAMAGPRRDR
jgi:hypothetical protein